MNLIKCDGDGCKCTFISKFCPDCGKNRNDIEIKKAVFYTTYLNEDDGDQGYEFCKKHGINPKSNLGQNIIGVNYEVKLVYKIVGDNLRLFKVNNLKVAREVKG